MMDNVQISIGNLVDKCRDKEQKQSPRKKDEGKIKEMIEQKLPEQMLAVHEQTDPLSIRRR